MQVAINCTLALVCYFFSYLLTTLEGALAYLLSLNAGELEGDTTQQLQTRQLSDSDEEMAASVARLFHAIAHADLDQVRIMLAPNEERELVDSGATTNQVCHPLCTCEKCNDRERQIGAAQKKKLTIRSRNEQHWTCECDTVLSTRFC